jgi:dolichol-phosphate mannosyltransferase
MMLTVVVPTYNEVGSLGRLADQLLQLDLPGIELRLLIVDDASTDGTAQVADELTQLGSGRVAVLHRRGKSGLGSAYVDGFAHALAGGADLIAQMDADFSHQPSVLAEMHRAIAEADLVIGSRYVEGGGVDSEWGWHRKLISRYVNRTIVPGLLSLPVADATSGYRLWRRDTLARIAPTVNVRSSGYAFQVEMAYLAHRLGCRIKEVPIYFHERETGQSKVTASVVMAAMWEILSIRRRSRRERGLG